VANGYFTQELGSTKLTTQTFNAGGDEIAALLGGSLDAGSSAPARPSTGSPSPTVRACG
jgi:NitT/TauT family transport system substrate-binding protein